MAPVLEVSDLTVTFGGVKACNAIDLTVDDGDFTAIVGPNGSGKTTLFRAISGEQRLASGRVRWMGRDVADQSQARLAKAGLVRTFQQSMAFAGLSVRDNLELARACAGAVSVAAPEVASEAGRAWLDEDAVYDLTGLGQVRDQPAGGLTTGMLRMLGVALALQAHPRMLMLDEPAAGLNPEESGRLAEVLRLLRGQGVTLVVIEHDMSFLLPLASRLIVLELGAKLIEGDPYEVVQDPRVIEVYLGTDFAAGK